MALFFLSLRARESTEKTKPETFKLLLKCEVESELACRQAGKEKRTKNFRFLPFSVNPGGVEPPTF